MAKSRFIRDFGKRVRELRLARGLSQEALADAAGLHRTAISLIEIANRSSTLETVEKIARALDVQPASLMPAIPLKPPLVPDASPSAHSALPAPQIRGKDLGEGRMPKKAQSTQTSDRSVILSVLTEEYRALYGLVPLRLQSLERRVPIAGATLAAFLGSITVLPAEAQAIFLVGMPLVLVWFLRTTLVHARSFEDLIRRIETIEGRVNGLVGDDVLGFQSSHPSRGKAVGGRTGAETVASVLVGVAVMLGACLYLSRELGTLGFAFRLGYPLYVAVIAGSLIPLGLSQRRYTYRPAR